MSKSANLADDQINLVEITAALWAHKFLIFLVLLIAIFLSANYSLTIQNKYTASAVFQIEKHDSGGFSVSRELGALASLAGLASGDASGTSNSTSLLEQVLGREFILNLNKEIFPSKIQKKLKPPTKIKLRCREGILSKYSIIISIESKFNKK